jgi:transposase
MRGVRLVVEEGWTQTAVGEALGVSDRIVRRWIKRYRQGGWRALAKGRRGRRAGEQQALSGAQQSRIAGLIAGAFPDQLRIPGPLWTRATVRQLIERETGVRLEISTVGRYLRAWGFTLKRPSKRALEQDPVVVQAWLEEVYPALRAKARRERAIILWGDESGIRLHALAPRAGYAPKGRRAIARIAGGTAGANMISAIANGGQMSFMVFEGRFSADVLIDFLGRLLGSHADRKIYLVLDNHSTHHAKKVRSWLERKGRAERLELVFLAPYRPELNRREPQPPARPH